jgi:hypothetical protein
MVNMVLALRIRRGASSRFASSERWGAFTL